MQKNKNADRIRAKMSLSVAIFSLEYYFEGRFLPKCLDATPPYLQPLTSTHILFILFKFKKNACHLTETKTYGYLTGAPSTLTLSQPTPTSLLHCTLRH